MKRRIASAAIVFSTIFMAILFFSATTIAADLNIEKFSPLSAKNNAVLTGDENITEFIQPDGQLGSGYRCGTLPPTLEQMEAVQHALENLRDRKISPDIPCTVTIPVAFHILRHANGITGDIPDQQIYDQIDVLNSSYANTNFQFELDSIERVNNTTWSQMDTTAAETAAKQALAIDPATTLNIYTCTSCQGYLGWSYLPMSYPEDSYIHGIVALYSSFPGGTSYPYDEGDTVTHEAGHYLGLYHTFQGGCTPPGDYIDDTPYEASPAFGCPEGRDTCPAAGLDPIHNFMDYSDDDCMDHFTADQSVRCDEMIETYKPSLISCGNGGLPDILWSDLGLVYVSVADLGVFGVNQWALMLHNYSDFSGGWGLGFEFYNPAYAEFGYIALTDDFWYMRGGGGNWNTGSQTGVCYSGASSGGLWTENFSTNPFAASADSADLLAR